MFFERNVVFIYPLCSELQELKTKLEEDENTTVYEMDAVAEFSQLIGVLEQSITFSSDPKKTQSYLEENKKILKSHSHRNILMASNKISSLQHSMLQRLGLNESVNTGLSEKALALKVDVFFRPFEMQLKADEEKKEKERMLAEKKQLLAMQRLEQKENAKKKPESKSLKLEKMAIMDDSSEGEFKRKNVDISFMNEAGNLSSGTLSRSEEHAAHLKSGQSNQTDGLQRKTLGTFEDQSADPKLKKTGIEFESGVLNKSKKRTGIDEAENYNSKRNSFEENLSELERKKLGTFEETEQERAKRKKLDLDEAQMNNVRNKFEEVHSDLNKKRSKFDEHHGDLNRKRPTFEETPAGQKKKKQFEENLADLNRKKHDLDELEDALKRKKKQFDEVYDELKKKRTQIDELDDENPKKKQLEEIELDLNRKKLDLFNEIEAEQKKKKLLLDEALLGQKKNGIVLDEMDFDKKRNHFDEAEAQGKDRKSFDEYENDLEKKKGSLFDEEELKKKKHSGFEEIDAEKLDRKNNFSEAEREKKDYKGFEEISLEDESKRKQNEADVYANLNGKVGDTGDSLDKNRNTAEEFRLEKGQKEEQTLDYSEFKKEKKTGEYSHDEENSSEDVILSAEEIAQIEDVYYYEAQTSGIEYYILLNDFLYRKDLKKDHVLKFINFALSKEYSGCVSFIDVNSAEPSILLDTHKSASIEHGIDDLSIYLVENKEKLLSTSQPLWSDETFQEDILEFIYPFYEDSKLYAIAICHLGSAEIENHVDSARVELLIMATKGLIQDVCEGTFKEQA